ncbi:MAG: GTPase HflX [Candidatus Neomarinimicrobiota bacterium]
MLNDKTIDNEEAILVGVIQNQIKENLIKEHLDELELLAETAGAKVIGRVTQKISKINPATFLGKGKATQLITKAKELKAKIIIFDQELTPAQIKNYHKLTEKIKVIDRSGLILDIFKRHAKTKEATTQVQLAYLQYLLPRLTRQWTHLERQMGGIGTRAGMGETQIEVDRRIVRTKISKLKKELIHIENERKTQGIKRNKEYKVSLVGYTNAGKSTLFKSLTGADVYIKNQLFATLDTTIRKLNLDSSHRILLSDTVGFIRKLPHNLVASFKSTLKEVLEADLILIVLDINSTQILDHTKTIEEVLEKLGAENIKKIFVLNKFDLIKDKSKVKKLKRMFPESVIISAKEHLMISELKSQIFNIMDKDYETINIEIPYESGAKIAYAQKDVTVLKRDYKDDVIQLKIRGNKNRLNQIISFNN